MSCRRRHVKSKGNDDVDHAYSNAFDIDCDDNNRLWILMMMIHMIYVIDIIV